MAVSELQSSTEQMLSLAWDGAAGSDVSSELNQSYEQLLAGILGAAGGTGTEKTKNESELWAGICNAVGGSCSHLTMSDEQMMAITINALGGSASHLTMSKPQLIAQMCSLLQLGLGHLVLGVSLFPNSNNLSRVHVLTTGAVTLTQATKHTNLNGLANTQTVSSTSNLTQSSTHPNSNTLNYTHTVTGGTGAVLRADFSNQASYEWWAF
jgi:hypothetical protein